MKRLLPSAAATLILCLQPILVQAMDVDVMARFKAHVNETVTAVKQADDPETKRALLNASLERMKRAADMVGRMPGMSEDDLAAVSAFDADVSDKLDQLNGRNGYEPVPDGQLDDYADYVQQDLEQAQRLVISLSLTALILILIIVLLLA